MSKLLIVDDDANTCLLLSLLFKKNGYDTQIFYTGTDAILWLQHNKPELIILDIMMPEMDGWETYYHVRDLYNVPVVFLTALSSGEYAARALRLSITDYIRKPFHNDELLARVEALVNKPKSSLNPSTSPGTYWITQRPSVSVIIPTMNEAANLPLVLPYMPLNWVDEVILVDGLSTDGTVDVARNLLPTIKVVMENRRGKGYALQTGYNAASGEILIVLDGDGSNDPREIPRYITALMQGADFVKGSRFAPGGGTTDMPLFRQFGNGVFVFLVNIFFRATFTDLCYGYHAFWKYCLDWIDISKVQGFEIDTALYLGALRQRLRIMEVPSFEGYRFNGIGHLRTIPDGFRVLRSIAHNWLKTFKASGRIEYKGFHGNPYEENPLLTKTVQQDKKMSIKS
jgi:CheY-like chemotaxis protein/glycosyltransferase involved in cell wall biosynthesis